MGIFGYFQRRRERESAVPAGATDSLTAKLQGDGEVIGQLVQAAPQSASPLEPGVGHTADIAGILGAFGQAMQTGNFQVIQGEPQKMDLRGALGMRKEILEALSQHGIDPSGGQTNIDAADYQGLQQQIMDVLASHGIDVNAPGAGDLETKGDSEPNG